MQNVKILKIWLSRVVQDFKPNIFVNFFEFGWEIANPHHWKCNSISYKKPSNFHNLSFFIDGKYSMVDTRHAYEVNEKRKTPFGLGMKEKQIVKYAHTTRIYTKSKKENPLR